MIRLENLCKIHSLHGRHKIVARNIHATFPSGVSIGLFGRNGAGKSTLLQMIAGTLAPDRGEVLRRGTVSWPVGFAGSFHPDLTGAQNTRFIARIYGVDTDELVAFVAEFAELGGHFHLPLRSYSSGMRARLAFGCSMGIRFDTYLVDEVTSVGDALFRQKSERVFRARLAESGAIVVSHSVALLERLCTAGAVLEDGRLVFYPRIATAIAHYTALLGVDRARLD
jgi:capsular polysaccharide transport system ATP-binding protein